MSAEGKKKRGEAGQSNAEAIPFRYHGRKPPQYNDNRIGRTDVRGTSKMVQAVMLGSKLPGFNPSQRLVKMTEDAMDRCTHPLLV